MLDSFNRKIDYLRISITDRCNLRCVYCMPECGVKNVEHDEILTYEEIIRICRICADLGVTKIKITGGEPMVRKDLVSLIQMIKSIKGIKMVTMTTNGTMLGSQAKALKEAGLDGVNISLDSMNREDFAKITRRDVFSSVIEGLEACLAEGIRTKINCVPIKELNGSEIVTLASLAKQYPVDVRFIELMPIGYGRQFSPIPNEIIKDQLVAVYGEMTDSYVVHGNGPAKYFDLPDFLGSIGFISAVTHEFCESCNRIRLTSEGSLKLCLHYNLGIQLKDVMRAGIDDGSLSNLIVSAIEKKPVSHNFGGDEGEDMEVKNMVQIGG